MRYGRASQLQQCGTGNIINLHTFHYYIHRLNVEHMPKDTTSYTMYNHATGVQIERFGYYINQPRIVAQEFFIKLVIPQKEHSEKLSTFP